MERDNLLAFYVAHYSILTPIQVLVQLKSRHSFLIGGSKKYRLNCLQLTHVHLPYRLDETSLVYFYYPVKC